MKSIWSKEPTMILAVIQAGLAMAIGFGLDWSTEQLTSVMAFATMVIGLIARSQVTSPDSLQALTPKTLAAAQNSTEAVKDTVRKLP